MSNFFSRTAAWTLGLNGNASAAHIAGGANRPGTPAAMYKHMLEYYEGNNLYQRQAEAFYAQALWSEPMKPLRNCATRVVEFYASHLWPGSLPDALPIETEHEAILEPIELIWKWSNWGTQKQVAARWLAIYGDLFIKVASADDGRQVYFQLIDAVNVTDLENDTRGFLRYIRLDIPQIERVGDTVKKTTHTEVWSKPEMRYRQWLHDKEGNPPLDQLPRAIRDEPITRFGIDFIPVVHAKLRDIGQDRGIGSYQLALDKIDEANRLATRLHQMLFRHNKATWALAANGTNADGQPLPPPRIAPDDGTGTDPNTITLGDDRLIRLPGTSTLVSLVPNINYEAALNILNAHMLELEKDLPELAYYRLRDVGALSGRAVRLLLSDAIDRALEARGNAEAALVRAHQMALTIGSVAGLFRGIGDYESGGFDHTFEAREVIPVSAMEKAETEVAEAAVIEARLRIGITKSVALAGLGYTEQEIADMEKEREANKTAMLEQMAPAALPGQPAPVPAIASQQVARFSQGTPAGEGAGK